MFQKAIAAKVPTSSAVISERADLTSDRSAIFGRAYQKTAPTTIRERATWMDLFVRVFSALCDAMIRLPPEARCPLSIKGAVG
jgi:hypothetical protein